MSCPICFFIPSLLYVLQRVLLYPLVALGDFSRSLPAAPGPFSFHVHAAKSRVLVSHPSLLPQTLPAYPVAPRMSLRDSAQHVSSALSLHSPCSPHGLLYLPFLSDPHPPSPALAWYPVRIWVPPSCFHLSSQSPFPVTGPHQFQSLDCLSVGLSDPTTSAPQHRQERQEAPIISSLNFSNNVFTVCSLVLQFWHLSSLLSPGGPGMIFLEHRLDIVPPLLQPCQRHPVVHRVTEVERLHVWDVCLPRADMSLLRSPVQMINPMVSHLIRTSERCHPPPVSSPLSFWSHSASAVRNSKSLAMLSASSLYPHGSSCLESAASSPGGPLHFPLPLALISFLPGKEINSLFAPPY